MNSSNIFFSYYFPNSIKRHLISLDYDYTQVKGSAVGLLEIKDRLLRGSANISILGETRFRVALNRLHYIEAIYSRFAHGMVRSYKLARASDCLIASKSAVAWILTTNYYSAYFAANELLQIAGAHVSSFTRAELDTLMEYAETTPCRLESGTYDGIATIASSDEVEITFSKSSDKPHEYIWQRLGREIKKVNLGDEARGDAFSCKTNVLQMLGIIKTAPLNWPKPNEVRNHWNYRKAALFSEEGSVIGADFIERAKEKRLARKWGLAQALTNDESHHASSIAFLKTVLHDAAEVVSQAVMSGADCKRLMGP